MERNMARPRVGGQQADTGRAMNVHRVSLTQQKRQRGDALGKT